MGFGEKKGSGKKGKSPIYTFKLPKSLIFNLLTIKPNNESHPTVKLGGSNDGFCIFLNKLILPRSKKSKLIYFKSKI